MSVVTPLPKEKAAAEVHGIYDALSKKFGKMPNIFGLMAHRPEVLAKRFVKFAAQMTRLQHGEQFVTEVFEQIS